MTYVVELWVLARFNNKWQRFISSVSSRKLKYGNSKALHKIKPIRKSLCLQDYYDRRPDHLKSGMGWCELEQNTCEWQQVCP